MLAPTMAPTLFPDEGGGSAGGNEDESLAVVGRDFGTIGDTDADVMATAVGGGGGGGANFAVGTPDETPGAEAFDDPVGAGAVAVAAGVVVSFFAFVRDRFLGALPSFSFFGVLPFPPAPFAVVAVAASPPP